MKDFKTNACYKLDGETAYFLGEIDGINKFKLEVDSRKLFCFYIEPENIAGIDEIDKDKIEIYLEEQLPESIKFVKENAITVNIEKFEKFLLTAKTGFSNSAFCPKGKLEKMFSKKGILSDFSDKNELGSKYSGVAFPDYCLVKDNVFYYQTGMREKYPDIIIEYKKTDLKLFETSGKLNDSETVYLKYKSPASYGGTHFEYDDWHSKSSAVYSDFFKGYKMAKFKRKFEITSFGSDYLKKLNLSESEIELLK